MQSLFFIVLVLLLYGCTATYGRSQEPKFWGTAATAPVYQVLQVNNFGEQLTVFVQDQTYSDVTGFYTVSESTGVFKQRPGTKESDYIADPVHPSYIKPGMQILLYPEGIVQDSIPAKGTAGEIIILQ